MSIFNFEDQNLNENILEKNIKLSEKIVKFINKEKIQKQIKKISYLLKFPDKELSNFLSKKIFFNICDRSTKLKFSLINRYFFYYLIQPIILIILKNRNYQKKNFKYIVDNIGSNLELSLYKNLETQEGRSQIMYLSENKDLNYTNIIHYNFLNTGFNFSDLINYYKIFFYSLKLSLITKVNFIYLLLSFLKEFYFYKNFFYFHNSKYLLTHKHYDTSNIKNFFFKKNGGKTYATIQKNISTTNSNSFFYNANYNFSFSNRAGIPQNERFTNLKKNIPVGSFFMENLFLNKKNDKKSLINQIEKYDVLYVAGNDLYPSSNYDTWNGHNQIYKEHLKWLKKASIEFPDIKFGFKHHPDNNNNYEETILNNSKVIITNSKINSYELAINSKLVVSFASTMIIELLTLGIKSFYLNPDFKNKQFLHDIKDFEKISIKNYLALKNCIINLDTSEKISKYDYCENSEKVTEKIISHLGKL